ncbi:MAG: hypothetical protein GY791_10600 [Alphaproteobacteria bacterium]|nr:hypothetical protein [Alphaproteobacteria bacterium]
MTESQVYQTAQLVMQEHGGWATDFALERAKDALIEGNDQAKAMWLRVLDSLQDLSH